MTDMTAKTETRIPMSRIQKLIGERMLQSKRTKPCYYIGIKADTTELMDSRHELKKRLGVKITSNAFYIKALGLAVKEFPLMVGSLQGDSIKIADSVNVGFAVSAPHGLVVPVVKEADKKTLAEIATLEKELTDKARSNKLTLDEITGETIGLSNLGVYDIDSFIGIVPPPATTILAVGNTLRTAVPLAVSLSNPQDGRAVRLCSPQVVIRKITDLTIAVDARVIEDSYAAKFLARIAELLQGPKQLI
jgi:pyruvate dehydrogenase E2 component (dihydrolipoamide acetyltransferase)